ncbi:MAG: hypothetical protein KIT17_14670 [Rubrivivax sp.]|nr:hypothetical protein [Rubrivivax sp.]
MADLPPLDAPAAGAPPDPRDPPLGPMVLRVALAMLALVVLQTVLTLPGARDPETWLGLGRADRPEVQAVREAWHSLPLLVAGPLHATLADAARLYWVLDTALFMPMYGWLLLELARRMAAGASRASTQRLAAWLPWFVLALLAVDLVENSGGLARLALQGGAGEGGATVAGAAVAALLAALSAGAGAWLWQRRLDGRALLAAMVSTRHWPMARRGYIGGSRDGRPSPARRPDGRTCRGVPPW